VHLIEKYGYPSETHFVNSDDGYKLCVHRIPRPGAKPVLLVHGLMSSSASWVELGPKNGLAYILYRKGYDVWMLNTRGNKYSREQTGPRKKPRKYWNFSFHEIGKYDVPATIDVILKRTNEPKLQYIGHSQGSTVFFVMCSEKPKYANKVQLMQALSPTVYLQENRSPVLKFISMFKGKYSVSRVYRNVFYNRGCALSSFDNPVQAAGKYALKNINGIAYFKAVFVEISV